MNLSDDDFTLFGMPARQALDRQALDAQRRSLQAQVHPDRFAAEGPAAQRLAMQWAVRVNEAYQRLRDPLSRAAYLCELRGVPVGADRNTAMPPDFLMQQMAWREVLEDTADAAAVQALDQQIEAAERDLHRRLQEDLDERADPTSAAQRVRELMFVARFRQDIDKRLDELDLRR